MSPAQEATPESIHKGCSGQGELSRQGKLCTSALRERCAVKTESRSVCLVLEADRRTKGLYFHGNEDPLKNLGK